MERELKNLIFKLKVSADRDPGKFELHPSRDWRLVVAAFLIVNLASALLSANLFFSINREEAFVPDAEPRTMKKMITRQELETALTYLEEKEAHFDSLLSRRPRVADPSR